MSLAVKICGLSTVETVEAARDAGADMIGLVFFPKSPRHVALRDAPALVRAARSGPVPCKIVALTVDADQGLIDDIARDIAPDFIQCHGSERAEWIGRIARDAGLPVIKALGVSGASDLGEAAGYAAACDLLLLDAKPPRDAARPGGHGKPFDWSILGALDPAIPFMLSGGLTPENVGEAIRAVRALGVSLAGVDVSSGVESAPGVKDVKRIKAFVAAARGAES